MPRLRTLTLIASLALSGVAFGQDPQGGSTYDQNRAPIAAGAGIPQTQAPIASFPAGNALGPVGGAQGYQPPRPGLSPYLNLNRGGNGRGINAIDYYNFVRPAQQSLGSYVGRQPGAYSPSQRYNGVTLDPDVQLDPDSQVRSAGSPAMFMNTGRYFNSMGTIGLGVRPQQQQQRAPTSGRR